MQIPIPQPLTGRALTDLLVDSTEIKQCDASATNDMAEDHGESAYDPEEESTVRQRLLDLGYLE